MTEKHDYVQCSQKDVPEDVRFHVPMRHQGQIVEVAFGDVGAACHDDGDPYMRITDQSDMTVSYFRRKA